ncbi:MAG: transposase [Candidatus Dormibacteraceae bacterium]
MLSCAHFPSARQFSSWRGLTPTEHLSAGAKL